MRRLVTLIATCLLIAPISGCGKQGPEYGEVSGTLRVGGKTHANLVVRFLPDPAKGNNLPINSIGRTDAQGKYKFTVADGVRTGGAAPCWRAHRVLCRRPGALRGDARWHVAQ